MLAPAERIADRQTTFARSPFIDWTDFWARDRRVADWTFEDILARGRGHSIFAKAKAGKSLLTLWVALQLIRLGHQVLYLDFEMSEADLFERLEDMGHGPGSDLSSLHYALLPSLPPLDTAAGGAALIPQVDALLEASPDQHLTVIVDTISRATTGNENDSDTLRAFYQHTGLALKQRGVTWVRLDHAGKDLDKGQRGSSAKNDDVDIVWKLTPTENGVRLDRVMSRVGWGPEQVVFRQEEGPLRFVRVIEDWPAGTRQAADLLDQLAIDNTLGERPAAAALRASGWKGRSLVARAAQRYRREREEGTLI